MLPSLREPLLYEINTWPWLTELRERHGRELTLAEVPEGEWERLAKLGCDFVWLMGVWERSPQGAAIAQAHPGLRLDFGRALKDLRPEDIVGSPYAIRSYSVAPELGGRVGLEVARAALQRHGLGLLLDFVPNHVARDHAYVTERPEFCVRGTLHDLQRDPESFFDSGSAVVACGRDPFFPAWTDVAQLDLFHPGLREAHARTLAEIAEQCDGVRCDMAMLALNAVFDRTWAGRVGALPRDEFWPAAIGSVRRAHPAFLFVAEAYWDLEPTLLALGFDHAYDKRSYDRLRARDAPGLRAHLGQVSAHQSRLLRFLENHDEARAAEAFSTGAWPAMVALVTLPGAKLLHEGQLEGRHVRLPVQLGRRPQETVDVVQRANWERLLELRTHAVFRHGAYLPLTCTGWPDNRTHEHLVAYARTLGDERWLIVLSFSAARAQGRVLPGFPDLGGRAWRLRDWVDGQIYDRAGDDLAAAGLFVELPPFGAHVFALEPA